MQTPQRRVRSLSAMSSRRSERGSRFGDVSVDENSLPRFDRRMDGRGTQSNDVKWHNVSTPTVWKHYLPQHKRNERKATEILSDAVSSVEDQEMAMHLRKVVSSPEALAEFEDSLRAVLGKVALSKRTAQLNQRVDTLLSSRSTPATRALAHNSHHWRPLLQSRSKSHRSATTPDVGRSRQARY